MQYKQTNHCEIIIVEIVLEKNVSKKISKKRKERKRNNLKPTLTTMSSGVSPESLRIDKFAPFPSKNLAMLKSAFYKYFVQKMRVESKKIQINPNIKKSKSKSKSATIKLIFFKKKKKKHNRIVICISYSASQMQNWASIQI